MDNVFGFREQLVEEYGAFSRNFTRIAPDDIRGVVEREYAASRYATATGLPTHRVENLRTLPCQ